MKNKRKQENRSSDRLNKAFRLFEIIPKILLFIGGVAMISFLIWLFVKVGDFIKLGL